MKLYDKIAIMLIIQLMLLAGYVLGGLVQNAWGAGFYACTITEEKVTETVDSKDIKRTPSIDIKAYTVTGAGYVRTSENPDETCLAKDMKELVSKAKEGDEQCKLIALDCIYVLWDTGKLDENKHPITKRASLVEWIAAGKPEIIKVSVASYIQGYPPKLPTVEEIKDLTK